MSPSMLPRAMGQLYQGLGLRLAPPDKPGQGCAVSTVIAE